MIRVFFFMNGVSVGLRRECLGRVKEEFLRLVGIHANSFAIWESKKIITSMSLFEAVVWF